MHTTKLIVLALFTLASTIFAQQTPSTSAAAYGNCPVPAKAGVHVCAPAGGSPIEIAAPFQLIASASGADGAVNHIELWADGKKVTQSSGSLFDEAIDLPSGTHRITLVEVDDTGHYVKSAPFEIDIQGNTLANRCTPSSTPGVNVCIPQPGSCHTAGWTTIVAAGTGASGKVARMELWENGVKLANFAGNAINTNLFLPDYAKITIVEVDSSGGYSKSAPITILSC